MGEDATGEKVPELLRHELGEAPALGAAGRLAEKGVQVGADDDVEDAAAPDENA